MCVKATILILLTGTLAVSAAPADLIDREIAKRWEADGVKPAPAADDYEFFRRIHLDVLGRLPRPDEIRPFVKDTSAGKRARAVDRLLESKEAARHSADRWLRLLLTYDFREADPFIVDFQAIHQWLEKAWRENLPYDKFVAALVSAEGEKYEKPETNFLVKHTDPKEPPVELTNRVTRLFLGIQFQCAQCHDHPYDRWSQDDYWGMAAFFGNIRVRTRQTFDGLKTKVVQQKPVEVKVVTIMDEGRTAKPRFLDGRAPGEDERPREALAKYMATMEGRQFAKAYVNREWAHYMGRGFVEPADKFSEKSRPSHPELLEALAKEFEENGYDMRRFARAVLHSQAYALSCRPVAGAEPRHFAYRIVKPQGPIEFLNNFEYALELDVFFQTIYDAFRQNKDLPETYKNLVVFRTYLTQFVAGLLAPGGKVDEAKHLGSVGLALRLMNNNDLQGLVKAHWGHLKKTLEQFQKPEERLEELFLTLFSRPPDAAEKRRYLAYIEKRKGAATAYEDVYWVLLNSPDFFFNH